MYACVCECLEGSRLAMPVTHSQAHALAAYKPGVPPDLCATKKEKKHCMRMHIAWHADAHRMACGCTSHGMRVQFAEFAALVSCDAVLTSNMCM
jgi:hypothetical protein